MANETRISVGPGRAVYPALDRPDTKFDELGQYKADLAVPLAQAEPLMKKLADMHKAHVGKAPAKASNTMWYMETDEDGEETGNVVFKMRIKNRLNRDGKLWDRKPKQFDAALRPCEVNPWGGSVLAVSAVVYEWDAGGKKGISLQPQAVQIIELVSGGGKDASAFGFDATDGFTAPENAAPDFGGSDEADTAEVDGEEESYDY